MDFWKISSYIISGGMCFALAIILLLVKIDTPAADTTAYQRIKNYVAYSSLIDVLVDVMIVAFICEGRDFFMLDRFFVPMAYYIQLNLIRRAFMGLIRSVQPSGVHAVLPLVPFAVIVVMYLGGYMVYSNVETFFTMDGYIGYADTWWAGVFSLAVSALAIGELGVCIVMFVRERRKYFRKLDNTYSGEDVTVGKRLGYFSYCILAYFVLAAVDVFSSSEKFDAVFVFVDTILFVGFVVFFLNMYTVWVSTRHLCDCDEKREDGVICADTEMEDAGIEKTETGIVNAIRKWEKRQDKPFVKDGIVVQDVADDLGITGLQLSFILNHSLKVNFNGWVNQLRIEEAKRIIKENPKCALSTVSLQAGFPDQPTFSRAFKRITGQTPSVYKLNVADEASCPASVTPPPPILQSQRKEDVGSVGDSSSWDVGDERENILALYCHCFLAAAVRGIDSIVKSSGWNDNRTSVCLWQPA